MPVTISVEDLSKRYRLGVLDHRALWEQIRSRLSGREDHSRRDFWSLRDVSFEVNEGEVVGLLGHNGAGKSTLLKIISQITAPTSGRVLLRGRVASLLEVGPGFHPELTGRDNIFVNGAILGMTRREVAQRFDQIVDFSGLEEFIDTPVKRYSVGMRVRLAFAIAAHLEPEILLVDEVLAVGDFAFQQKCLGKISEVAHSGRTVLFVSHNAAAIEALCTRGIVLEKGRVVFDGTQNDAVEYYASSRMAHGIDLRTRTDRAGTGEVRATAIQIRNSRGQTVSVVRAGDDIAIGIQFERSSTKTFPRLAAQLLITTRLGAPVFTQANWLSEDVFGDLPADGELVCKIPNLPLPAGHFRIGFILKSDRRVPEVLDSIESGVDLYVESGNFFGSGNLPPIQQGVCLVRAAWHLQAEPGNPKLPAESELVPLSSSVERADQ